MKIETRNPEENLRRFQARLAELAPHLAPHRPNLVCLPECAFTGYVCEIQDFEKFAESIPGQTTAIITKLAQEYQVYICFGMLEKAQEGVYSSAVLVDQAGKL
ncbi:MAG: carbon-nitrogen hydrolase family protein, partial [Anaerolineae bacterium]|nr:carbon-nitrogen hydrolase family protein [Thermoflexales bacterium]MDW8407094.1 carbon-nitrogen hydrolase family protein [Anaerolineae bacterium]